MESTSLSLGDGVGDRAYLAPSGAPAAGARALPADLVYYVAGCDPAADDVLGNWHISADGMLERDRFVVDRLRRAGKPPTVILLAGGYGRGAWRYTARFLGWLLSAGQELEVPSSDEITLRRFRVLSTLVSPAELTGDGGRRRLGLTEEDVFGALGPGGGEQRFLGYYSRHGLELALERLGILRRLRDRGFRHPTVEFDLDNPAGQTLRVFSDAERASCSASCGRGGTGRPCPAWSCCGSSGSCSRTRAPASARRTARSPARSTPASACSATSPPCSS